MPLPNQRRVHVDPQISIPDFPSNQATIQLVDHDGQVICRHCFAYPKYDSPLDTPAWFNAQFKIAQSIADALNAAPNAAIEYIRQSQRESIFLQERAERKKDKP